MTDSIQLIGFSRNDLLEYLLSQLHTFFPVSSRDNRSLISCYLDESLERLRVCINSVRWWKSNCFDPLHSSQYCIFLYYLSNTIWRDCGDKLRIPTKLFSLNKAFNAIDLFYEIAMPDKFFIGHSAGIVLAKATYSDYLVLYQGCTVGKNHGVAPFLEERVLLYPGSKIIGGCHVRPGSIIGAGVNVINQDTLGESLVFQGNSGSLQFKPIPRNGLNDIFYLE